MNKVILSDVVKYSKERIKCSRLTPENYVGIDNLLQNKQGKVNSLYVPANGTVTAYYEGNILIGNIRPYLRKIWYASNNGGNSADVLTFKVYNKMYDSKYVYYCLFQDCFFDYAMAGKKGSKMPRGDKNSILNSPLPALNLPTQRAIARVLSQLDEKIELNRKINAELENMAKTIYDYWFLQFDFPNAEGKPYRSSGGAMEYNKQMNRNIPVGWQVKTVKHCVKKISTGLNPRKNFVLGKGTNKYLTIKNIDNGRLLFDSCDLIDDEALKIIHARSDISVGDILFTSIDPVGRLYYILEKPEGWDINESVFSVRTNTQIVSAEYLYSVFDSDYFKAQTLPLMTGSVQKGIRIAALESIPLVVPEARIIKAYTEKVRSIYERKAKIEKESIELAALRDFLLPLLMNGQVTVEGIA